MTDCEHHRVRDLIADGNPHRLRVCKDCEAPVLKLNTEQCVVVTEDHTQCTLCEAMLETRQWDSQLGDEVVLVCSKIPTAADDMWRRMS